MKRTKYLKLGVVSLAVGVLGVVTSVTRNFGVNADMSAADVQTTYKFFEVAFVIGLILIVLSAVFFALAAMARAPK